MAEGHDDTIVHLMSMGFDLQDCQDAINFGKINVEAAVEWIVAGKPGLGSVTAGTQEQSGPSLKLRPTTSGLGASSTAPYQKPHPIPSATAAVAPPSAGDNQSEKTPVSQSDVTDAESDQSEVKIVSRMHMSESQRQYKARFEQKKIDEARKSAVFEKRKQKEEHARILKEIAEDREKKKLITHAPSHTDQSGKAESSKASTDTDAVKPKTENVTEQVQAPTSCILQIRLPGGLTLRHSFNPGATLLDVWNFTAEKHRNMDGFIFIQPFPRHEFTKAEMSSTLSDLKLTPTGSLVLQKKQQHTKNAAPAEEPMETTSSPEVPVNFSVPNAPVIPHAPPAHAPSRGHQWGQGLAMEAENQPIAANEDAEEMEEEDDEEGEQVVAPHAGFGQGMINIAGQQMPPPLGNIMGQGHDIFGMQVGQGNQGAFGGVGQRLVVQGEPGFQENYQHRSARELALERAQARMAQPVLPELAIAGAMNPSPGSSQIQQHVTTLLLHCLKHITNRLNDPRHQLLSLAGISEDMAQVILEYLLKEKQLKPKTLNAFIPCYLRKLVLDCYPYATNELLHSIRLHTNLGQLSVSACPLITDQGLQCLNSLKKLRKLNLSCCQQLTNKCLNILTSMQNLVSLNLEQTGVTDAGVIQYLQTCPTSLLHLNVNRTLITANIFPHIHQCANQLKSLSLEDSKVVSLQGIERCLDLESLNLARTGIVTESLLCLRDHPNLVSLNIANTENVNGDIALQNLQGLRLHTLMLPSRHSTTNMGIQYIADMPLTSLDLTNYIYVSDEAMEHISKLSHLKKLLLSNTKLTDEGMLYLENLKHVEVLHLDRTLITDEGASVIASLTNLIDLSMACTGITTKFMLSGACNNCTNLSKLNLSKTRVTNKGILTLSLPFLQMLNLDGTKVTPDLCVIMATMSPGCPQLTQVSLRNLEPFTRDDEIEEAEMNM